MNVATLKATLAGLGVVLAASVVAQTAPSPGGAATAASVPAAAADRGSKLLRSDAGFLRQAAQSGHAEVESGKLALSKAVNTQVKGFAQQMIDDHTKAHQELEALAKAKGVALPSGPSLVQKAKLKMLSAADGTGFDRRYADSMGVAAHEDTLKLFRKAAADAADPEVKAFAAKTLPTLEQHLKAAKELKQVTGKEDKPHPEGRRK